MRIVYHLGAHCTDEERLLRCLVTNRKLLAEQNIAIPDAGNYRRLLRDTAVELKGSVASPELQAKVLHELIGDETPERAILSWDSFLSFPQWALRSSLYGFAGERVRAFTQIFPQIEAELALGIRNPATFLPALFARQKGKTYAEFMEGCDPRHIRWSDVVRQILAQSPNVQMTIWCDEEAPLIWPEVLQAVSGHDDATQLAEADELIAQLMNADGLARMRKYMASHPPANVQQRRRIHAAFLEKFALPGAMDYSFELPGWTEDLVQELTANYREDIQRLADIPNVDFIMA